MRRAVCCLGLAAAGGIVMTAPARSQDMRRQELYRATLNGVYVTVAVGPDEGLEISGGKPPDHVSLSAVLPEAALAWVDSGSHVLAAVVDTSGAHHDPITLSSGMLQDSTHSAVALDRLLSSGASPCSLFFVDGANQNHVRADVPCATAQEVLDAVRRAAAAQQRYDDADSTAPAALAAKTMRAIARRQDSLAIAAQSLLTHHRDSAAGAIP
jgi:hypothetical protein